MTVDETLAADFEALGAPFEPEEITKTQAFEVLAVNSQSFEAFLECRTQWRTASTLAGITFVGLDYSACKLVLEDLQSPRHVFSDLRVMEREALNHLNGGEAR
ncbi:DUF1799 domain-containing protein [Agrobacterium pusense]|uniref:DUF1799 domain-containing protein n=1 Tax=Agrobacterium pusense TaxID=648995 RepID=UPI000ED273A3|nr:hypothetical protein [Agrobacterium sp.]